MGCLENQGADLCSRAGFRSGRYLGFWGSLKLVSSPHLRGGDKGLGLGVFGMDFFSASSEEISFPAVFVEGPAGDGHLFWECPHFPFVQSVRVLYFMVFVESGWEDLALVLPLAWLAACACLLWWGFSLG